MVYYWVYSSVAVFAVAPKILKNIVTASAYLQHPTELFSIPFMTKKEAARGHLDY